MMKNSSSYPDLLREFCDAWNRHDTDAVVNMMTSDGIFDTAGGSSEHGNRNGGTEALKRSVAAVFSQFPDAQWTEPTHIVSGDRGFSEWTFVGTSSTGQKVRVRGVDVFTFRDGKIAHKDTFRKQILA